MHDFALQYKIFIANFAVCAKSNPAYALLHLHKVSVWLKIFITFYNNMLYELIYLSLFDTQIKEKG